MIIKDLLNNVDHSYIEGSKYINSKGFHVPRVTTILSTMIHSDVLMYWANNLGFKHIKYKEAITKASNIGTEAHYRIELFLKDKLDSTDNIPYLGFKAWWDFVVEQGNRIEVLSSEEELSCEWFGGTCDAVISINGRIFLIDFKTSNHVTYKYFLQLAAYKYMLELKGVKVDGVIVLQLDKEDVGYNEYILDFAIPDHNSFMYQCTRTFFSLVYGYYNLKQTESMYDNIYGKE